MKLPRYSRRLDFSFSQRLKPGLPELKLDESKKSIYRGQTWTVFEPGEDARFTENFVLRDAKGDLHACLNTLEELLDCAQQCQVGLKRPEPVKI